MDEPSFEELRRSNPQAALVLDLTYSGTYQAFADKVEEAIDGILDRMAENPQLRLNKSEDELTVEIIDNLRTMGVEATLTSTVGGHCDVVVRGKRNFAWLGEAKIDHDLPWILKGYRQLFTRYSTGQDDQNRGGLIIYVRKPRADIVLADWKAELAANEPSSSTLDCPKRRLAFLSDQTHPRTGAAYRVRHVATSLFFEPQDRQASPPKRAGRPAKSSDRKSSNR